MTNNVTIVDIPVATDFAGIDIPDDAPDEFRRELMELKAIQYGGTIVLFAAQPERLPLWGWLRRLGKDKS